MKYHIHIYEVKRKFELDVEASNELAAKQEAIALYNSNKNALNEVDSDCRIIVLAFNLRPQGDSQ